MENVTTPVPAEGTPAPQIPSSTTSGDSPALSGYAQKVELFLTKVEAALAEIGVLGQRQASSIKAVRGQMNVPDTFIDTATAVAQQQPDLAGAAQFDLEVARDSAEHRDAFMQILNRWDGWRRDVKFAMDAKKAPVAANALKLYRVAKSVAAGAAGTAPDHAQNLRRDLARTRPSQRKKAPVVEPSPASPSK